MKSQNESGNINKLELPELIVIATTLFKKTFLNNTGYADLVINYDDGKWTVWFNSAVQEQRHLEQSDSAIKAMFHLINWIRITGTLRK